MRGPISVLKTTCLIVLCSPAFISCQKAEDMRVASAQDCLNKSTPSTADTCNRYVSGMETKEAYTIRCAASFISQGLTTSTIAKAIDRQNVSGTRKNPALGMIGALALPSLSVAKQVSTLCKQSGSASFATFAALATSATVIASSGGVLDIVKNGGVLTQQQIEAAMNNLDPTDPDTASAIGESALTISTNFCQNIQKSNKICDSIKTSMLSTTNTQTIGTQLLQTLNKNN